jgi:hypothetical protein
LRSARDPRLAPYRLELWGQWGEWYANVDAPGFRRHGLVFAQNGEDSIGPSLGAYDGWNREDVTSTYDFATRRYLRQPRRAVGRAQRALRRIAAAGLLVLGTDYLRAGDHATAARSIADACAAGALPFLSDIELTRIPATPARCQPSRGP